MPRKQRKSPANTRRIRAHRVLNPKDGPAGVPHRSGSAAVRRAARPAPKEAVQVPPQQPAGDGRIGSAVETLLKIPVHDAKGRFVRGMLKTFENSQAFWTAVEPVKADIVARVRRQLAADDPDAPETLLNVIDGYAEAVLLRKSAFTRMCLQGGPVTSKGQTRGLLQAWGTFYDREMRTADKLGLTRRARQTQSPAEWLRSLPDVPDPSGTDDEEESDHDETPEAPTAPGRHGQPEADPDDPTDPTDRTDPAAD